MVSKQLKLNKSKTTRNDSEELDLLDIFATFKMSSMFQNPTAADDSSSEGSKLKPQGFASIERRDESGSKAWTAPKQTRALLYPYSIATARAKPAIPVRVGDNKKVSMKEFAAMTQNLLDHAGLGSELEERKDAYIRAVLLAHVVNSASVMTPARASIEIDGYATTWNYSLDVLRVLGPLPREYFRTAADEIVKLVRSLFAGRATASSDELEMIASIEARAMERGMTRTPEYAFDAADGVTADVAGVADRYMIVAAKSRKLATLANPVDTMVGEEDIERSVSQNVTPPRDKGGVMPF